jgi:hypothetical protein
LSYLRTRQAAEYMNVSQSWLEKRRYAGDGPPFIKAGRLALYGRQDVGAGPPQGALPTKRRGDFTPSRPQFVQNAETLCADPRNHRKLANGCALQILDGEEDASQYSSNDDGLRLASVTPTPKPVASPHVSPLGAHARACTSVCHTLRKICAASETLPGGRARRSVTSRLAQVVHSGFGLSG